MVGVAPANKTCTAPSWGASHPIKQVSRKKCAVLANPVVSTSQTRTLGLETEVSEMEPHGGTYGHGGTEPNGS